jgi:allantoinase
MKPIGIHSNRCWIDGALQEATIFFEEGKITSIEKGPPGDRVSVSDAGNDVVMPGVIDSHVHVNEPGRTAWEGFDTATAAAAAGGITTIVDMPLNASPVTTTVEALRQKLEATAGKLHVNAGFYGGLVPGNGPDLDELIDGGILGIKAFLTHSGIDEFPNVGEAELAEAMPLLARRNIPLLVHCELTDSLQNKELALHPNSYSAYLRSRPADWEIRAIDLMIRLCRRYGTRVHIVHVSAAGSLSAIKAARAEGLPLTAETCPHYILFDAEGIPDSRTINKCAPPIRDAANNKQLKDALRSGVLDFVASDHSPAPPELKEIETGDLEKAWGGIAGLQFLLPASWTALKDTLSLEQFIPLLTERPARFLGLSSKGRLTVGADADITVWSPEANSTLDEDQVLHRHKATPYAGRSLYGPVRQTWIGGILIAADHQLIQKNRGQWLLRK